MTVMGHRVYYGWVMVVVTTVCSGFASGVAIWGPSVFIAPMREELHWSLSDFFLAFTVRSLVSAVVMPLTGPVLDRSGGARVLAIVSLGLTVAHLAALRYVGQVPALDFLSARTQFYLLFGAVAALGGAGSGFAIANAVLPKWFVRQRGRAMGIASAGGALGPLVFPALCQALIGGLGWRDAWLALALVTLVVQAPLVLLVRTRPEDMGLVPDGDARVDDGRRGPLGSDRSKPYRPDVSLTRAEALRTRTFWFWMLAMGMAFVGVSGFQPNWVPFIRERGFSPGLSVLAPFTYGLVSAISRVVWGALGERIPTRRLLIAQSALTGLAVVLLLTAPNAVMVIVAMTCMGLTMGAWFILQPLLTAEYFGRAHLGSVSSAFFPFLTLSGALAPVAVAALHDARGDYVWAFSAAAAAWLVTSGLVALTPPPKGVRTPAARS